MNIYTLLDGRTLKNRKIDTKMGAVHEYLIGQLGYPRDRGNNNISYLDYNHHRWMDSFVERELDIKEARLLSVEVVAKPN